MSSSFERLLCNAISSNHLHGLRSILSRSEVIADGNLDRPQWIQYSPLHVAVWHGYTDAIKALVVAGVDVNSFEVRPDCKATALHYAVYYDKVSAAKLLMDLGADPELEGNDYGYSGTVLDWARKRNDPEMLKMLEEEIDDLMIDDSKYLPAVIERIRAKKRKAEMLDKAEKIQRTIEQKEREIAALKSDKDFMTAEDIEKLQEEVDEMETLIKTAEKRLKPMARKIVADMRSCYEQEF